MIGNVGVQIAIAGPIAAAIVALAIAEDKGKFAFTSMLLVGGAAGAATAGVETAFGNPAEWRGFQATAFRAVLCTGALLCAAAGVPRLRNPFSRGAGAMAAGLAAGSLFAPDMLWMGLTLFLFTAAIATVVRCEGSPAWSVIPLAISDVVVLAGLGVAARHSLQLGSISGLAAWLLLIGGLIRLLSVKRFEEPIRPLIHGCARAQGVFLCLYGIAGSTHRATWLLIVAAVGCGLVLLLPRASLLPVLLVMAGMSLGGTPGIWGMTVALVAMFSITVLEAAGSSAGVRAVFSFGPAFGSFVAALLVSDAVVQLAIMRTRYMWAAVPIVAGLVVGAMRAWDIDIPNVKRSRFVAYVTGAGSLGILGLIAFAPTIARTRGLMQISSGLGITGPLGSIPKAELGVIIAVLAVLGFVFGGIRSRYVVPVTIPEPIPIESWPALEPAARRDPVVISAIVLEVVAFALALHLFLLAGHHGWL